MGNLIQAAKAVLNQYSKSRSYLSADIDSDVMEALRQALELPKQDDMDSEQEPVAWAVTRDGKRYYVDTLDYTQFIDDITNHGATYEPLYTSPNNHIPDVWKKVYVPMSKEEHLAIAMQCMGADNWQQEAMEAVEAEVVRRMKEQGLI